MRRLAMLLPLVLSGCSNDLPPSSRIDKLRVLAVQAEPPEVEPGHPSALDVLTAEPLVQRLDGAPASPLSYVWLACTIAEGTAELAPCGVTPASPLPGADSGQASMPPLCKDAPGSALCVIGTDAQETFVPTPDLAGARSTQMLVSVTVSDAPDGAVGCLLATANAGGMPQDPDHCVLALKRLVVTDRTKTLSDGSNPDLNHNPPPPASFFLADVAGMNFSLIAADPAPFTPSPTSDSAGYTIDATLADGSVERETTFDSNGNVSGQAYEALTVSFFATAGKFDGSRAAYLPPGCATQQDCPDQAPDPDSGTIWTPDTPDQLAGFTTDGTVRFWAVLRDDRGGVSWVLGAAKTR